MSLEEFKEEGAVGTEVTEAQETEGYRKPFKREWNRFEFALFINDFLICKRSFPINGYIDGSMQTQEFKSEVDKIVDLIDEDLKSKSRVYTWYHNTPDYPTWEPEIMTEPLIPEGEFVLRFVIYDSGKEVISKQWDARYYPSYVRKNIDLTNRQVKITKEDRTNIYDKEKFFADHGNQLSGDLYVLKSMIYDKENLVPAIQKLIYETCSSYDGLYEKVSDYHAVVDYKNSVVKRDADGNIVYKTVVENGAVKLDINDQPMKVPVYERCQIKGKRYNLNIEQHNKKLYSTWGAVVAEKTRKYMSELYVSPKERFFKKREED